MNAFDFVHSLLVEFSDIVRAGVWFLLVYLGAKVFHIDVRTLLPSIAKEARELLKAKVSTGSINALGLLLILVFGIFLVVADELSVILGALSKLLGMGKAKELVSGGAWIAFGSLCLFAFLSVRAVKQVELQAMRARQKKSP